MKAHQKLLLAHHSRPSFQNNLLLAYNILHKQKSKHYNLMVLQLHVNLNYPKLLDYLD